MSERTDHVRVEVALPLPIFRTFTYRVDGPEPAVGTRVLVPFRRDERIGWVVGPGEYTADKGLKAVLDVLDDAPTVPADVLALCRWMAEYYIAPLGIAHSIHYFTQAILISIQQATAAEGNV